MGFFSKPDRAGKLTRILSFGFCVAGGLLPINHKPGLKIVINYHVNFDTDLARPQIYQNLDAVRYGFRDIRSFWNAPGEITSFLKLNCADRHVFLVFTFSTVEK